MLFRFSIQFNDIIDIRGTGIDVKQMISDLFLKRDGSEDVSSGIICDISGTGH